MNSALTHFIALAALLVFPSTGLAASYYEGCYSQAASNSLQFLSHSIFQSREYCVGQCSIKLNSVAATTNGDSCWCGNSPPPKSSLVDDTKCDVNCGGFPLEHCGGVNTFSIYLTGVGELDNSSSSSSGGPSSSATYSAPLRPSSTSSTSGSEAPSTSLVSSTSEPATSSSPSPTTVPTLSSDTTVTQTAATSTTSSAPTTQPNAASNIGVLSVNAMLSFIGFAVAAFL